MVDNQAVRLTRFEIEIKDVLWKLGSASIREIHEQLKKKKQPAYTTVQTIIRRLEEKAVVRRTKQIGNAHIFEPLVTRDSVHRRLITELLDILGGSARPLMARLAEAEKLSLEVIKEIETMLSAQGIEESPIDKSRGSKSRGVRKKRQG